MSSHEKSTLKDICVKENEVNGQIRKTKEMHKTSLKTLKNIRTFAPQNECNCID
jgi:hypothetical protein